MELKGQKVLVVGSGKSGIGAARLLGKAGALPVLFDSNEKLDMTELREKTGDVPGLEIVLGELDEEKKKEIGLVVISPGVPIDAPMLEEYRSKNIPIWGEIELAYAFAQGNVIAITGTNGKTTTTTLVGQIMKAYFDSVYVVGNIGNPYTDIALQTKPETVTVAEISSFQLETVHTFHPRVSAILNITPDHLNRHHTMECYVATKEKVAQNQTAEDTCVLNYEDAYTREFGNRCPAKVIFFSSRRKLEEGVYLDGEEIVLSEGGKELRLMNIHDMNLVGMCNVENVMAAIAISRAMNVPMEMILNTIREFKAVEHRIEFVATKNGVDYYNDSKGTNPDSSIKALEAMSTPTILIAGGYDKNSSFDEFIDAFGDKVKLLVLLGKTAPLIEKAARNHGFDRIETVDSLESAVKVCYHNACSGDAVLLSPACASWDMFKSYEERGELFKKYVNSL